MRQEALEWRTNGVFKEVAVAVAESGKGDGDEVHRPSAGFDRNQNALFCE